MPPIIPHAGHPRATCPRQEGDLVKAYPFQFRIGQKVYHAYRGDDIFVIENGYLRHGWPVYHLINAWGERFDCSQIYLASRPVTYK